MYMKSAHNITVGMHTPRSGGGKGGIGSIKGDG